jgi:hypothetical protein
VYFLNHKIKRNRIRKGIKMNTQNKNKFNIALALVVVSILVLSGSSAFADDLNPPSYRGNPLSVNAEWQLVFGTNFLNLTQWSSIDDSDSATNLYPFFTPSPQIQPMGDIYQFQVPNWVDQMPVKYMRLQLTWLGTTQPPINLFSEGLDGVNLISGVITYSSPVQAISPAFTYQYFDFEFHPNLDFERVHIQLPPNGLLSQVVVDTVSTVPEPATIGLLGLGVLSLLRRKNSKR